MSISNLPNPNKKTVCFWSKKPTIFCIKSKGYVFVKYLAKGAIPIILRFVNGVTSVFKLKFLDAGKEWSLVKSISNPSLLNTS